MGENTGKKQKNKIPDYVKISCWHLYPSKNHIEESRNQQSIPLTEGAHGGVLKEGLVTSLGGHMNAATENTITSTLNISHLAREL